MTDVIKIHKHPESIKEIEENIDELLSKIMEEIEGLVGVEEFNKNFEKCEETKLLQHHDPSKWAFGRLMAIAHKEDQFRYLVNLIRQNMNLFQTVVKKQGGNEDDKDKRSKNGIETDLGKDIY